MLPTLCFEHSIHGTLAWSSRARRRRGLISDDVVISRVRSSAQPHSIPETVARKRFADLESIETFAPERLKHQYSSKPAPNIQVTFQLFTIACRARGRAAGKLCRFRSCHSRYHDRRCVGQVRVVPQKVIPDPDSCPPICRWVIGRGKPKRHYSRCPAWRLCHALALARAKQRWKTERSEVLVAEAD